MTKRFRYGLAICCLISAPALAQTTAFTYQGKLVDNGNLANGSYDLQFKLFDTQTDGTGTQIGALVAVPNVTVSNGVFTVQLDFGACPTCFNGAARFLEIAVKPTSGSTFTTLGPRQPLTSAPYALKSQSASTADGLSIACTNCITSSQIQSVNGSAVTGPIPVGSVPAGSASYVQNGTAQQAGSNFNVSGDGTAGGTLTGSIVNAVNQVNINGLRSFTVNGAFNDGAGTVFTATNTFAGDGAGVNTTPSPTLTSSTGKFNSFYGAGAGQLNTTGFNNAFFGFQAGFNNTTGFQNAFFGNSAGQTNTTGNSNAFFGTQSGASNTTGSDNAFFGAHAGLSNTTQVRNTFIGVGADFDAFTGTGDNNTLLGASSRVISGSSNATAIGAFATVSQSNSLVLGSISGVNGATADTNVGIGTTAPQARLTVSASSMNAADNTATFYAPNLGGNFSHIHYGTTGDWYIRSASSSGKVILQDSGGNVGIGTSAPAVKLHVSGTGTIRARVDSDSNAGVALTLSNQPKWSVATVTGGNFQIFNDAIGSNAVWIDTATNNVGIGTTAPADKLEVNGVLRVNSLGSAGGTQLCRNLSNQIANCSSSIRYKTNIAGLHTGMSLINRLRPVTFDWKQGGKHDLGLVAEEVAKVEPLLVTHNEKGEVEGVKYDRLGVVLLNAVKEQQAQIVSQQAQLTQQSEQMQAQQRTVELQQRSIEQQAKQIQLQQHLIERQQQQFLRQQQQLAALQRRLVSSQRKSHTRR